jgi:hypothetical protein
MMSTKAIVESPLLGKDTHSTIAELSIQVLTASVEREKHDLMKALLFGAFLERAEQCRTNARPAGVARHVDRQVRDAAVGAAVRIGAQRRPPQTFPALSSATRTA